MVPEANQNSKPGQISSTKVQARIVFKATAVDAERGNNDLGIIISLDLSFKFCGINIIENVDTKRPAKPGQPTAG